MKTPNLSNYKGIMFDLDGTLIDSMGIWNEVYAEYIRIAGGNPHDPNILENERQSLFHSEVFKNGGYPAVLESLNKLYGITGFSGEQAVKMTIKLANEKFATMGYRDGADILLNKLHKQGKKLALVTTSKKDVINTLMENPQMKQKADMQKIFGTNIITAETVKHPKPEPDCYLKATEMLNLDPKDILVFEDALMGVLSARRAKLDTCVIYDRWANIERKKIMELTPYHIQTFHEILQD